ncbi:hypothetical protein BC567DRAFT_225891 [Phyllosticta citribraziliensis]
MHPWCPGPSRSTHQRASGRSVQVTAGRRSGHCRAGQGMTAEQGSLGSPPARFIRLGNAFTYPARPQPSLLCSKILLYQD